MNKVCIGMCGMTNLQDRFSVNGFREDVAVIGGITQIGQAEDVDGTEPYVSTQIGDTTYSSVSLHIFQPIKGKTGDNLNSTSEASEARGKPVIPPLNHSNRDYGSLP